MKTLFTIAVITTTALLAHDAAAADGLVNHSVLPTLRADDPTLLVAKHPEPPTIGRYEKPVPREVPLNAHPSFMEAVTAASKANQHDPAVKAAEAALSMVQGEGPSPAQDEAILKLEAILVEKAKGLRPAAKYVLDRRAAEVEAQLEQIKASKTK